MKYTAKLIRILTVAPIMALLTVTILYFNNPLFFESFSHYIVSVVALTVFPLLAYPLSLIKPEELRRKFQRSIAIVFSVVGYIFGIIFALITKAPSGEIVLYSTYLLSGILIAFCSFVLKKKSSGHACGIAGPITILCYYISPLFAIGYLLLIPVFWASIKMKRHSLPQLISGGIIPILCLIASIFIIGI